MAVKYVCPVCIIRIIQDDKSIQCEDQCQRFFHQECAKLSNKEYSSYVNPRTNANKKWVCRRADCGPGTDHQSSQTLANLSSQMATVLSRLGEVLEKVDKIDTISKDVSEMKSEVMAIKTGLANLEPRVTEIEDKQLVLVNELSSLKPKIVTNESRISLLESMNQSIQPQNIIGEINDRAVRARNVMLYNVGECDRPDIDSKIAHDKKLVHKLIEALVPDLVDESLKVLRVGKPKRGSARPLKIIFRNDFEARKFFEAFSNDAVKDIDESFAEVSVSKDRTLQERQFIAKLKSELEERTSLGEKGLTIKFRNGIPAITKKLSKNS